MLIYEVQPESAPDRARADFAAVANAIDRRLNSPRAKRAKVWGFPNGRIEIAVEGGPAAADRVEALIDRAGTLELRILANKHDHQALIEKALGGSATAPSPSTPLSEGKQGDACAPSPPAPLPKGEGRGGGPLLGRWVPIYEGSTQADRQRVRGLLAAADIAARTRKEADGREANEVLVVGDEFNVTGAYLAQVAADTDNRGQPCVNFRFNAEGGQRFRGLTSANLPDEVQNFTRKLGIILDGKLHSAPSIQSVISDRGEITGNFTKEEVEDLASVLNAGALPAKVRLIEKRPNEEKPAGGPVKAGTAKAADSHFY
jgi:SecD/SecF fusion protein